MKAALAPVASLLLVVTLAMPAVSNAQGIKIGPQIGFNLDGSDIFAGLEAQFNLPILENQDVWGNLGFDYYPFIDHISISSFNVDILFPVAIGGLELYGGGGLVIKTFSYDLPDNIAIDPSGSDVGLDLKAGWLIGSAEDGYRPFFEVNQTLGAGSDFMLRGGVFIAIGSR